MLSIILKRFNNKVKSQTSFIYLAKQH